MFHDSEMLKLSYNALEIKNVESCKSYICGNFRFFGLNVKILGFCGKTLKT